jgi:hypothetical protein
MQVFSEKYSKRFLLVSCKPFYISFLNCKEISAPNICPKQFLSVNGVDWISIEQSIQCVYAEKYTVKPVLRGHL